jgi:hypothetical protein
MVKTICAGIFNQSIGRYELSRNKVVIPARQATSTQPGGIDSLESILGLLKSLKIRALELCFHLHLLRDTSSL